MPNHTHPSAQSILAKIAAVPAASSPDNRYRSAILSSALAAWHSRQPAAPTHEQRPDRNPSPAERIPIPQTGFAEQRPLIHIYAEILAAKRADSAAAKRELQWQLDELVYALYGLTAAESTAIERSLGLIHATDAAEDGGLLKWMQEGRTGEYVSRQAVLNTLRNPDAS